MDNDRPKRQNFKRYPVGYFHIDIAELRTNEDKRYLFVAIDRTSKFAVAQLVDKANRKTVWEFLAAVLEAVLEAVPYKIHTILTDNVLCAEYLADLASGHCRVEASQHVQSMA